MNDEELKLLAERHSIYQPVSRRNGRRLAVWLLALALAGMAALWFLWPGEGRSSTTGATQGRRDAERRAVSSLEERRERVQDGAAQNDRIKLAGPVGPGEAACGVEQGWVRTECVRPIGGYERRSCQTARTSLRLCRMGR